MKTENDVCKEALYEKIFLELSTSLRNFLLYKFRNLKQAEDVVQEAFFILWKNCKNVTPELAKAYLYKVAQNQFLKLIEKEKVRNRHSAIQTEPIVQESPQFKMEYDELSEQLQKAIEQLPDGQREAFLLNRIDKMTYAEIAELQGVSKKAVEKRMHKALIRLREICKRI
ncbi:MAG: sigma-70 family RNA polymerase sigma factor [Bacteroidota bacterium]